MTLRPTTADLVTRPIARDLSILSASADPVAFARILQAPAFAEIEAYPHTGSFGRAYHPAIHSDRGHSFVVFSGDVPVIVCQCSLLDGILGFYGLPMCLIVREGLREADYRAAIAHVFSH